MRTPRQRILATLVVCLLAVSAFASAYNAHPKLVVIVVIDQFRGDLLERYHDQFGADGFRLFLDRGAYFNSCNYDYANTRTGPGHATLGTGAYTSGHGIMANEWWDAAKKRNVTCVEDDTTRLLGATGTGASPRNLLADTLGDELKLATQGKARVFGVSLKDRAAILSTGYTADYAFWIDHHTGQWLSSTYYGRDLPEWVKQFNADKRADKYLNLEWKDSEGRVLRSTAPAKNLRQDGQPVGVYENAGATPYANDYELEFARELIAQERLGSGPVTDLLVISLSANDILGHQVGPDSPASRAMVLALDRQLGDFFGYLGKQIGLANVWIALTADHGVAPLPSYAAGLRLPAKNVDAGEIRRQVNATLATRFGRNADFVRALDWPVAYLNEEAFATLKLKEADAEQAVGEALKQAGMRSYFTRAQLAEGRTPDDELGRRYLHSYSPYGGWYVMAVPPPFVVGYKAGTDHSTPYSYDTHVPLGFFGLAFRPGLYRGHCEPVDLAATLAALLGINPPAQAVGHVLTGALVPSRTHAEEAAEKPAEMRR